MVGFGKIKKREKKLSTNPQNIHPSKLKDEGINEQIKGNINSAEAKYIAFLKTGLNDPDVLSNYGLICQGKGLLNKALNLFEKSISLFPEHLYSKVNLAYLYFMLGQVDQSEVLTIELIKSNNDLPILYSIYSLILHFKGDLKGAEQESLKALKIDPNFYDAYINLGLINKDLNKLTEAESYTLKAIEINPGSATAYLNLGGIYKSLGNLEKAVYYTKKSISIEPNINSGNINLAAILVELEKLDEALIYLNKEISLNNESGALYQILMDILTSNNYFKINKKESRKMLNILLDRKDINHNEIFKCIDSLVEEKVLIDIISGKNGSHKSNLIHNIIKDKEIKKALKLMVFHTSKWERLLTKIRRDFCLSFKSIGLKEKYSIDFLISLASQCFLNEYIYYESPEEKKALNQIKDSLIDGSNDKASMILIACYEPLYNLSTIEGYYKKGNHNDANFMELVRLQVKERLIEEEIKQSIKSPEIIKNQISLLVKQQYEENPYPRWRYSSYFTNNQLTLDNAINSEISPNSVYPRNVSLNHRSLNILIAGCGTGKQILDACRYKNYKITAIDISSASLSYAQRKTSEYGMEGVDFIQLDILNVGELGKKFDLIECSGVLHHMENPYEGLKSLIKSLKAGGYIKLGLYSDLARKDIIEARKIINEQHIQSTKDGITNFRKSVIEGHYPTLNHLSSWSDFFTTSMCRDLCFHSNEFRYTINDLKLLIKQFNLRFLGFILPKSIKKEYQIMFPNDFNQTNLDNWNQFELSNKNTFKEMYQFWAKLE